MGCKIYVIVLRFEFRVLFMLVSILLFELYVNFREIFIYFDKELGILLRKV